MDTLDKETFREFMRQVFDRLDRHERLFDNQDLCLLLQVSKRSLQRYRSNGALAYHLLWHKTYYKESDVLDFITKYMKDFQKENIGQFKARINVSLKK